MIDDVNLEPFLLYKRVCRRITYKFKKLLFENWNGCDYYDGEYIKDNLNLNNASYPTIDHKISIFYGFINNIEVEKIGNIDSKITDEIKEQERINQFIVEKVEYICKILLKLWW